jgi:hypothetical protein
MSITRKMRCGIIEAAGTASGNPRKTGKMPDYIPLLNIEVSSNLKADPNTNED